MKDYNHQRIEKKWQRKWQKDGIYKTKEGGRRPKCYVLDMFPYPSGSGLHVGHPKGYIATDIYSRFKRMNGFNVLHPMGWDAFGLPAENYAIKNKVHPEIAVKKNIKYFKSQLALMGFSYDWSREINTTDPEYYRWTQWIFLKMFKAGLAYESYEPINWCPSCQTGLANEDLENGLCERCGSEIEKKPMRQWVLKITDYADRLLTDLDDLDWPESIKEAQRHWIGRSEGAEIGFSLTGDGLDEEIKVFTTRPDTLFGVTYLVLSPEHPILAKLENSIINQEAIRAYQLEVRQKTEIERTAVNREKTGIQLDGIMAINPANQETIPVFVADYVLAHYGTGAVMAVPAHDERDFVFAEKYNLPIKKVIDGEGCNLPYIGPGKLINSGQFNNLNNLKAKSKIVGYVNGRLTKKYKLRDWVFSRQRYWGEPIPIVHCDKCGVVPVAEKDLPVKLPKVKSYAPAGTGESPLATIDKWVKTKCPKCGGPAKRETNTMPQWAGSSWYYLRYADPQNKKSLIGKRKEKYWLPVDLYVGGTEHATRHLIYARFWHKFLYDIKAVSTKEPFTRFGKNLGLILGEDGRKMSKRWGNVINPDDVVSLYGADTLRIYTMFIGPFEAESAWNTKNIIGTRRFLDKVWRLRLKPKTKIGSAEAETKLHQTIHKVSTDIESFSFNTVVSAMMVMANQLEKEKSIAQTIWRDWLKLLAPLAPHLAEELWALAGYKKSIHLSSWPVFDPHKVQTEEVEIVVQINGKVRDRLIVAQDLSEEEIKILVLGRPDVSKWLQGRGIKKIFYVKNRLINLVL